jgi:hypothetical protein
MIRREKFGIARMGLESFLILAIYTGVFILLFVQN